MSTCPVCKATLLSKVQTLGKKANDAVFGGSFNEDGAVDDEDNDSGEVDDNEETSIADEETSSADGDGDVDENESEEQQEMCRSRTVESLVQDINEWTRAAAPLD